MLTDTEFLVEVNAFLDTEALLTPGKSVGGSFQQLHCATASPLSSLDDDIREIELENYLSSTYTSANGGPLPTKTITGCGTDRRQKYRQRIKDERQDLDQKLGELSLQLRELIAAKKGTQTTARTDVVLSESFWKQVAAQQREQRFRVEAEHKRLLQIINAQNTYIENMGIGLRECPSSFNTLELSTDTVDRFDDIKWLRLKSSDATLYEVYLQEVNDSYSRVDKVFEECAIDSMPIDAVSCIHPHNPNGNVHYTQYANKFMYPLDFDSTCNGMWEVSKLPHRQLDRAVFKDLSGDGNTVAFKFRLTRTLVDGSTVSILKRVLSRRFRDSNQVVIVWKIFSEGEGVFSGMDVNETRWGRVRPYLAGSSPSALIEACSRQTPVQYISDNADDPVVNTFRAIMQDAVVEDTNEFYRALGDVTWNQNVEFEA